jgi:hypothetical protein
VPHPLYTPCRGFYSPNSMSLIFHTPESNVSREWSYFLCQRVVTVFPSDGCVQAPPAVYRSSARGCHRQMLLGMLACGWLQPSQQDIENSTHIFTPDVLEGWCFGGRGQGRIANDVFLRWQKFSVLEKYTYLIITETKDGRSEEEKQWQALPYSSGFSWRRQWKAQHLSVP